MTDGTSTEHLAGSPADTTADLAAAPVGGPVLPPPGAPGALVEHGGTTAPVAPPVEASSGAPVAPGTAASGGATAAPPEVVRPPQQPYVAVLPTIDPADPAHLDHVAAGDPIAPGHTRVQCPNCDSLWEGNDLRPHAEWFCGKCDFPLFWARSGAPSTNDVGGALARLPGTDGRDAMLSLACPHCGEMNPPVPTANCLRCHLPLTVPEVAVALPPPAVLYVQPEPVKRRRIWPWVVATCVLAAALIVVIIVLIND